MHGRIMLLALAGLALGGCYLDPEDPLFAYGRIVDAHGQPVEGATVQLWRSTCGDGSCGDLFDSLDRFEHFADVRSGPDGSWVGEVTYRDTFVLVRGQTQALEWLAVAQPDPGIPPTHVFFAFYQNDVDLPPLVQWDPQFHLQVESSGITVAASAPPTLGLPPGPGNAASMRTERAAIDWKTESGATAWSIHLREAVNLELPLEIAEDFALEVGPSFSSSGLWSWSTNAVNPMGPGFSYSTLSQEFPAVPLSVPGPPRIPVSRGLPCTPLETFEPSAPLAPCPATDGSLEFPVAGPGAPVPVQVVGPLQLDFPTPVAARLVLVRAAASFGLKSLLLEVRAEGQDPWSLLAELPTESGRLQRPNDSSTDYLAFPVPAGSPSFAALRLRAGAPFSPQEWAEAGYGNPGGPGGPGQFPAVFSSVGELSVFE